MLSLPHIARDDVAFVGVLARWLGGARNRAAAAIAWRRTSALVGGPVRVLGIADRLTDPHAAHCELRVGGVSIEVLGASAGVRHLAQRVLGGPAELAAPRPLGAVEEAVWALAVAAAIEDLEVAGEVWACEGKLGVAGGDARELAVAFELAAVPFTVAIRAPRSLAMRAPETQVPPWADRAAAAAQVVVGRCALAKAALARLAPRSIVTLDRVRGDAELVVLGGALGLAIRPGAVVAEVATGYVVGSMSLPDDAHVELVVGLPTTQLSLRQVFELAVGQVVPLGRPLAGPFEIHAAGALVGRGELVDVDGELGVRIVSLTQST